MNVFIVHAHQEPQSFVSAMKDAAVAHYTAAGHTVVVSDLYAMKWNPVAGPDDFAERGDPAYFNYALEQRANANKLSPDIEAELQKLQAADLVIFSFPLYWFSVPAILKGWIDRVLVSGRVYGGRRIYDKGMMAGKRATVALATGARDYMLAAEGIHGDINAILKPVLQGTLGYVGFTVLPPYVSYHVPYLSEDKRLDVMTGYQEYLHGFDTLEPMKFPSLADFDPQMQRLPG